MAEEEDKGSMTVSEAGRKGGLAVSRKYGHDHYVEIGQKGGRKVREAMEEYKQRHGEE